MTYTAEWTNSNAQGRLNAGAHFIRDDDADEQACAVNRLTSDAGIREARLRPRLRGRAVAERDVRCIPGPPLAVAPNLAVPVVQLHERNSHELTQDVTVPSVRHGAGGPCRSRANGRLAPTLGPL